MLRCSSCGELVSEYALRCSECGHGVEDAIETPDSPVHESSGLAPNLPSRTVAAAGSSGFLQDPAPSRDGQARARKHQIRRAVSAAIVLGVLAAGTATVLTAKHSKPESPKINGLDGRIVAESTAGTLISVDPGTGGIAPLSSPPISAKFATLDASPDGSTWLDSAGNIISFGHSEEITRTTRIVKLLSNSTSIDRSQPFADKGQAVVVVTRAASAPAIASVVSLVDGSEFDLGTVDSIGGDPQTFGGFVSVPTQQRPSRVARSPNPDSEVELRSAGEPPAILATAAQLNHDVGWLPSTPIQLGTYPSPTGDAVAVVLTPVAPVIGDTPLVILTRQGDVLATFSGSRGPMYGAHPVWSPGGREIAYPTYTTTGAALGISTETGTFEALAAPTASTAFGTCLWAPSSNDVLCQSRNAQSERWLYATRVTKRLISVPSRGEPLAWIETPL